jgi:nicotinamide-nucleotide amidase
LSSKYKAEILSIGTELLRGEVVDTNANYLATELPLTGMELHRVTMVGDNFEQLCETLRQALERSRLVIATGGLGPTEDDLTREVIAEVMGEKVSVDPELERQLREIFKQFGREMSPHNIKQAWLIPSAESLPNPRGTAPGWWVKKDDKVIVAMPGPPREMTCMWQNEVKPRLLAMLSGNTIVARTIKLYGLPEAEVAERAESFFGTDNPILGIYAKPDGIHLRIIAQGNDCQQILENAEARLIEIFGPNVWGKDEDSLIGLIAKQMINEGLTLAIMEDGTGGRLANIISGVPDNQKFFRGSLVAPSDETKIAFGVPAPTIEKYGAVSPEVAEAMAEAARQKLSADIGLSTSGILTEYISERKRPGMTYIGIADDTGRDSWPQNYARFRDELGQREAIGAFYRLRERLRKLASANFRPEG